MSKISKNRIIAWLEKQRLSADQYDEAVIDEILNKLLSNKQKAAKPERYQEFVGIYNQFMLDTVGVGAKMDASEGKALKDIIQYLKEQSKSQDIQGAIDAWRYVLDNWHLLSPFLQSQKSLKQINKNLIEILTQIKNGHAKSKQQASEAGKQQLKQELKKRKTGDAD
jgi:hypothetical protein